MTDMADHVHNFRFDGDDLFVCKPCPDETKENLSGYDFSEITAILNDYTQLKAENKRLVDGIVEIRGWLKPDDGRGKALDALLDAIKDGE